MSAAETLNEKQTTDLTFKSKCSGWNQNTKLEVEQKPQSDIYRRV